MSDEVDEVSVKLHTALLLTEQFDCRGWRDGEEPRGTRGSAGDERTRVHDR